jgi:3-hydroxyisobutyrate dehydrogenase-like beta-hydroxyacid dehydrogenase
MAHLGFVGLGMMGSGMVKRLLAAGHTVTGHNRTKSRAEDLIAQGMIWVDSPREAAQAGEIVISSVADNDALQGITGGSDGVLAGLSADQVYVDMSTVSPVLFREIAQSVAGQGAFMLDAPVSGSKLTLEMGKLAIMVGGDENAFARVKSVLEDIGPTVMYVGASGQAMALKLGINLSIFTQILTLAEGALLAEKYGVPRKKAVEIMLNSAIASPAMKYRGPFIADMPDEAWFSVDMGLKDLSLALEFGRELGVPLPSSSVCNDMLVTAREMGLENQDFAIIVKVLEQMAGLGD